MTEMAKLRRTLTEMGVPWSDYSTFGKERTLYMGERGMVAAISGMDTYGGRDGLLEAWNPGETHSGWLHAEEVPELFPPARRRRCTTA